MKNNHRRGRGNIRQQQIRRKARMKNLPPRTKEKHELIDGNMTYYAVAYCSHYQKYLTQGLIDTHRCENCFRLRELKGNE